MPTGGDGVAEVEEGGLDMWGLFGLARVGVETGLRSFRFGEARWEKRSDLYSQKVASSPVQSGVCWFLCL